jgi:hypothetical protein
MPDTSLEDRLWGVAHVQASFSLSLVVAEELPYRVPTSKLQSHDFLKLLNRRRRARMSCTSLTHGHANLFSFGCRRDPLVGKAQAQRGLNASQVGVVFTWQSITLRSRCFEFAQVCTRLAVSVGHGQQCLILRLSRQKKNQLRPDCPRISPTRTRVPTKMLPSYTHQTAVEFVPWSLDPVLVTSK